MILYFYNEKYNLIVFAIIVTIFLCNISLKKLENNNVINNSIKDENTILNSQNIINFDEEKEEWIIEIPKINLYANIKEGTDEIILDEYVGHFEETKRTYGNIGLAAHNRGYKVNYFSRIKELEKGDLIYYQYNDFKKVYEVEKEKIILDTDWSLLENTEENYLTLITCLENVPQKRRCIIAKEKL